MDRLHAFVPTTVAGRPRATRRLPELQSRRDHPQSPFPRLTFRADLRRYRFGVDLSTAWQNPPWLNSPGLFNSGGLRETGGIDLKNEAESQTVILSECQARGFSISSWLDSRSILPQ